VRFSVWPNPQQPWSSVLDVATHAEATGWDGVWFADHFMPNAEDVSDPVLECWAVVAALAASVPRVRLGTLVCGNTYRHPAVLANIAAATSIISGGRLVLGLGAGWQENEHAAYGIPFFTVRERLERLDEACQVVKALFTEQRATFQGHYYQLADAPLEPKPSPAPPLLIGGGGERVTMRIAARYADEWNTWGTPDVLQHKIKVLEQRCDEVGRDPSEITRSAQALLFLSDDEAFLERMRGTEIGRAAIVGTVDEVREVVAGYAKAGVDELIVPDFTMRDPSMREETYDRFIEEIAPDFR
jgi:F420-dependent oxidoreductase-like protein